MSGRNENIIEEFRANDGKVGGTFAGTPLLLLHHLGARTRTKRISPLVYQKVDDSYAIFASKGGADTNPDWYHNILAHPETEVEVGNDRVAVVARVAVGDEHDRIWERQVQVYPAFGQYLAKTVRVSIPVLVLEPA